MGIPLSLPPIIITGTLGLQIQPTVSLCLWLLRIQTLVLMLVEGARLPMSHLPGLLFRNRKYNASICSFCLLASWAKITKFKKDHAVVSFEIVRSSKESIFIMHYHPM